MNRTYMTVLVSFNFWATPAPSA